MKHGVILLFSLILVLSGCSQSGTGTEKMDYEETKKMVVDILKTDDGKKAIQDIMTDDKMRSELIMDNPTVKTAIEDTLTSDKGKQFWEKSFKDSKFAATYAKGLKSAHEKLLKDLMKDPDYRASLIELFKDPELQKELSDLAKSNEMREMTKSTVLETMDSPLVLAKIEDILLKAAEDVQKEKSKKEDKESGKDDMETESK